jgi:phosphopantetheinyl transferase
MIEWIESFSGWSRRLPAALICTGLTPEQRRALPQALAAGALDLNPDAVLVTQATGYPPMVTRPLGSGLFLSIASRGPFTAAAIATSPVGIDVEIVDPEGEIPWNVLHPGEATILARHEVHARPAAAARLWSLKEAYLKALGLGLSREPTSFAVRLIDDDAAAFEDPQVSMRVAEAETTWRAQDALRAAVSMVVLERQPDAGYGTRRSAFSTVTSWARSFLRRSR